MAYCDIWLLDEPRTSSYRRETSKLPRKRKKFIFFDKMRKMKKTENGTKPSKNQSSRSKVLFFAEG